MPAKPNKRAAVCQAARRANRAAALNASRRIVQCLGEEVANRVLDRLGIFTAVFLQKSFANERVDFRYV